MADSLVSFLFKSKRGAKIGELLCDATLNESHSFRNEITEWPVEDGSNITDHIRRLPDEVEVKGFITNSPVTQTNAKRIGQFVGGLTNPFIAGVIGSASNVGGLVYKNLKRPKSANQVELALDILLRISGRKIDGSNTDPELVDVVCGLRSYSTMGMVSLDIQRDAKTGEAMPFTARFKKVITVKNESVKIPNPNKVLEDKTPSTEKVKVSTKKPTEKTKGKLQSVAFKLANKK